MTEKQWSVCKDLRGMLAVLPEETGERKLRLFACACCRRVWHLVSDSRSRDFLEMVERDADRKGNRGEAEFDDAQAAAWDTSDSAARALLVADAVEAAAYAAEAVVQAGTSDSSYAGVRYARAFDAAVQAFEEADRRRNTGYSWVFTGRALAMEAKAHCALLRDIVGNPFRGSEFASCWRTPSVVRMAQGIEATLAFDRLPVLADALEEAGCTDDAVLSHCRGPGPHVRGCWVVDLLLGKG